jgi:hypothetical protein
MILLWRGPWLEVWLTGAPWYGWAIPFVGHNDPKPVPWPPSRASDLESDARIAGQTLLRSKSG